MGNANDKADFENITRRIFGDVKNLTDHQREGESKRQNLAEQLELLSKVIQDKKNEVETKQEQIWTWGK